jgi:hypothetical protein
LDEFVAARTALASELKGAEAQRVKALKKPTIVPWAVNRVYWHARPIFDRVQRSGAELRQAQIAALEGRAANVHAAADAHRQAIASAVERAVALAGTGDLNPSRDAIARTFEALSLAADPPEPLGRLTRPLQPGGFELLAGVEPIARPGTHATALTGRPARRDAGDGLEAVPKRNREGNGPQAAPPRTTKAAVGAPTAKERAAAARRAAAERERARALAAAARRHDKAIAQLEREVERAKQEVARARLAWDRATDAVSAAERRLSEARGPRRVV